MLEKEIENILAKYPENFWPNHGMVLQKQQLTIDDKRFDLVFKDKYDSYIIVEVKRGTLLRGAIDQILDYYGKLQIVVPDARVDMCVVANVIPANIRHILEERGIDCKEIPQSRIVELAKKNNEPVTIENEIPAAIKKIKKVKKAKKENPNAEDAELILTIKEKEYQIGAIRILPMSKLQFVDYSITDLQIGFFFGHLITNDGLYRFPKLGISLKHGNAYTLFQFDNKIVASAVMTDVEIFKAPIGEFSGAYKFDIESIEIFNPISLSEINSVAPEISKFSQAKQYINSENIDALLAVINEKSFTESQWDKLLEEYPEEEE